MGHLILTLNKIAGESLMKTWLTENGYSNVSKENLNSNEYAFLAYSKIENIMVQVRTFCNPARPLKLSELEADVLCRRAAKLKLIPYAAYVIIDEQGNLLEDIIWERLK